MPSQDKPSAPAVRDVRTDSLEDRNLLPRDHRPALAAPADPPDPLLRGSDPRQPGRRELVDLACRIYAQRRARDRMLDNEGRGLFGEPAWDMLLSLYCLPGRGEVPSITSLSYAANVALTTGLRWQKVLMREGLMEIVSDMMDLRRRLVRLTSRGNALMESYLTRVLLSETVRAPAPEQMAD